MRSVHFWRAGFAVLALCLISTETRTLEAQLMGPPTGGGLQPAMRRALGFGRIAGSGLINPVRLAQQTACGLCGAAGCDGSCVSQPMAPVISPQDAGQLSAVPVGQSFVPGTEADGGGSDLWSAYCDEGGCTDDYCDPCPPRRCGCLTLFGEYLYLRSRDAEVAYAVPIDGPITDELGNGIQNGPTAVVDPSYDSGFRVGGSILLNDCSQLRLRWTNFETNKYDTAFASTPDVLRSLVSHPLGNNAATDSLRGSAFLDIEFELLDLTYRAPLKCCPRFRAEYFVGIRYGTLDQDFRSQFTNNGTTSVNTAIDFDGTGPTFGLGFERPVGCVGLYIYSRGDVAFLAGKSDARYQQYDSFGLSQVDTSWESGRIVTQLEWELGMGWSTPGERMRVSCGYLVNGWFNTVKTEEYINAVQANNPDNLGDTLSFDGMSVRAEVRF